MKKSILLVVVLFTLVQCKPQKENVMQEESNPKEQITASNKDLLRGWYLKNFEDFDKSYLVEKEAKIKFEDGQKASAKMGCNTIMLNYKVLNNNKIEIKYIGSTRMACPSMELENRFIKKIESFNSFEINNHHLTLKNDQKEEILCIAEDWD